MLGLNFGLQGVQFTATSTVAENQSLSNSVYVHSIPSNNDNQDIVSMGSNAALMCARVVNNSFEVLAVECIAVAEAIDCLDKAGSISATPKHLYDGIRKYSKKLTEDRPMFGALRDIKTYLQTEEF